MVTRGKKKRGRDEAESTPHLGLASKTVVDQVSSLHSSAGIERTQTRGGWCLRSGLEHLMTRVDINNTGSITLNDLIHKNGAPKIYNSIACRHGDSAVENLRKPENCFESLCRIIAGQQLAGAAAQSVWKRLLETTNQNLTPASILSLAKDNMESELQKPAGLSGSKARSIVDLSHHFNEGKLNENLLTSSSEETVRSLLLDVKGIGPWSCDMFLMFHLERGDIFPVGDLGVRKGLARHFRISGGAICPKKDLDRMLAIAAPYHPYRSLLSYYMWAAADNADYYTDGKDKRKSQKKLKKAG